MSKQGDAKSRSASKAAAREKARTAARRRKKIRTFGLPVLLGVAVLVAAGVTLATRKPEPVAHAEAAPVLGKAAAPVLLAEWADFQCHACGSFARSVEPELRKRYIDTGKVKLEWHDFSWYGPESKLAANAARCAGDQDKFWQYHTYLYHHQGGVNSGAFSTDHLLRFGGEMGLDGAAFSSCVKNDTHLGAVLADLQQVKTMGLVGTPTFYVNGTQVPASQDALFAAIDAALVSA